MAALRAGDAVAELPRVEDLASVVARLLSDPAEVEALGSAARTVAAQGDGVVDRVLAAVRGLIPANAGHARS